MHFTGLLNTYSYLFKCSLFLQTLVKSPACDPLTLGRLFSVVTRGPNFQCLFQDCFQYSEKNFISTMHWMKFWRKMMEEEVQHKRGEIFLHCEVIYAINSSLRVGFESLPSFKEGKKDLKAQEKHSGIPKSYEYKCTKGWMKCTEWDF